MADLTISAAATLTGSTVATSDLIPVLHVAAATGSKGSNITVAQLFTGRAISGGSAAALTGLGLRSTGAAFDLTLATSEVLTAGRTLSFNVGDAARTLSLTGSPTLSGITTTGTGTLALSTFTLTIPATGTAALLGTANVFTALQTSNAAIELGIVASATPSLNKVRLSALDANTLNINYANSNLLIQAGAAAAIGGSVSWLDMGVQFALTNGTGGANRVWLSNRTSDSFGLGLASSTPVTQTFGGAQGLGSNITGGTLNIGTAGTGTGTGGVINFQTHAAGSTGSTLGTLATVMQITSTALVTLSSGVALKLGNTKASGAALVSTVTVTVIDNAGNTLRLLARDD